MALLCSSLGFIVDQRYKILESMSSNDTIWSPMPRPGDPGHDSSVEDVYANQSPARQMPGPQSTAVNAVSPPKASCRADTVGSGAVPKAPPCQCACSANAASDSSATKSAYVFDEDDDDFVSPARLPPRGRKRARTGECCGMSCSSACPGDAPGKAVLPSAVTDTKTCSKAVIDIEDTVIPKTDGATQPKPPHADMSQKADFKGGGDGENITVIEESETPAEVEVIDVSSSSNDDDSRSPDSSQAFSEYSTQEFLSQTYFDEESGEYVSLGLDTTISRDTLRSTLSQRTREPTPGGEFGPTRYFMRNLSGPAYRVPKIYYASRTHLQLDQVANEIKRTPYCDARVVVLSSREQTCINDGAFRNGRWYSRTEMCHELLDNGSLLDSEEEITYESSKKESCFYYRNTKQYENFSKMESINVGPIVDIYSLIKAGRRNKFCPYFAARNLVASADIVLCPVNYLIDPLVRKSMNMNLKGEIIIIDEAHMLEDMCRETASLIISVNDLNECNLDCLKLVRRQELAGPHQTMADFLSNLNSWIETNSKRALSIGFGREKEFSLPSCQLIASFGLSNVTNETFTNFVHSLKASLQHKDQVSSGNVVMSRYEVASKVISSKTETTCERLALILDFVFKHPEDYVGSISLSDRREMNIGAPTQTQSEPQWCMKLVCQNPALIFETLSSITRSIIFSSATLNPMSAFAAELGVQLPNTAIKGHVIPPSQTWIGCLPKGKNGKQLYGVYNTAKTDEYMDEIGAVVLDICQRVPYGILVFVTSYRTLDKMIERWRQTGIWTKIGEHKRPFQESRRAKDFNDILKSFYQTVEAAQEALSSGLTSVGNGCTGPLLIAVMRGKVSEGFNFADDKTRAIITVGIPYPNIHEDSVRWKKEYNKIHNKRNLQDPEGWYNTQAFRALSQSLGRGLRHRQDWCLLLLLEARLQQPKYFQLLPEWMYKRMLLHHQYSGMLNSVEEFIKDMNIDTAR